MKGKSQTKLPWCPWMNAPCEPTCRFTEHQIVERTEDNVKVQIHCKWNVALDIFIAKALGPKSPIVKLFKGG